jgi:hypothetical protein
MHPGPGGAWLAGVRRYANPAVPTRTEANLPSATPESRAYDAPGAAPLLELEFRELAARWRQETEHLSSTDVFTHPDYQRIIGLGSRVVPLLVRDLATTGAHWFWALRAITGENPVPAEDAGNVRKMIQGWLAWGAARGLV